MKKMLFIFNPTAGRGRLKARLFDIVNTFVKYGFKVQVYPTQEKGDATTFLMNDQDQYDLILCAGGDGTLNEVVSGMLHSGKSSPIGLIPAGSMNDVGHSFKISHDIMKAAKAVLTGKPYLMDIGKLNGKYFIYVAAFGAFTNISYTTSQKQKNAIGNLAYYLEGIKQLSELRPRHIRVEYGDKVIAEDFLVGLVSNSLYIAGFKNFNSNLISLNDGLLEMLLIKMPKNPVELQQIINSLINYKINKNLMYYIQTPQVTISSPEKLEWTLDGEFGGIYDRVEIENYNKAIRIISNAFKGDKSEQKE